MISIVDLLKLKGLDCSRKIKFVRHQDPRYDFEEIYRTGNIEIYQSFQGKPIFKCDYIVSFLGLPGTQARFIGVYAVGEYRSASEAPAFPDFPHQELIQPADVFYDLEEVEGFEDLKDRVVIDWGKSTRSWVQWLKEKEVVEILPTGYVKDFPGYLDVLRIPTKTTTQSNRCQPPNPTQADHPIQGKATTRSDAFRPPAGAQRRGCSFLVCLGSVRQ